MSNTNTGGPAFPVEAGINCRGMTLRDYFAAKAMQGLIAREGSGAFDFASFPKDPWRVAQWAYQVADEMLKARGA